MRLRAFEVRAIDYLLKPVKRERLAEAIARASELTGNRASKAQMLAAVAEINSQSGTEITTVLEPEYCIERQKLVIQDGRSPIQFIPYQDIIWIDAAGDYMCVHTSSDTYVMRARLKSLLEERLPRCFCPHPQINCGSTWSISSNCCLCVTPSTIWCWQTTRCSKSAVLMPEH